MNPFAEYELSGIKLRNRFVMSAAAGGRAGDENGRITDEEIRRYTRQAEGGVGLIITGGTGIHASGSFRKGQSKLTDDRAIPAFQKLTQVLHDAGAKVAVQLCHSGAWVGCALKELNHQAVGPSRAPNSYAYNKLFLGTIKFVDNYHAASEEEIWEIIRGFGDAARRAQAAGFDAVQIHGAHDSLLSQFLSPDTNLRQDQWGGSLENRLRIHLEILKDVRQKVGCYPVLIKLGVADGFAGGLTFAEGKQAAQILAKAGYDALEISQGQSGAGWEETCLHTNIGSPAREGYFRGWCREIKHSITTPTIMTGGLRSYEVIREILENQETDLIGLCRPLICEPDLIKRWQLGDQRRARCSSCNKCVESIASGKELSCFQKK